MSHSVTAWKKWVVVVIGCVCAIGIVLALAHRFRPRQPESARRQTLSPADPSRTVRLPLSNPPAPGESSSSESADNTAAGKPVATLLAQNPNASLAASAAFGF